MGAKPTSLSRSRAHTSTEIGAEWIRHGCVSTQALAYAPLTGVSVRLGESELCKRALWVELWVGRGRQGGIHIWRGFPGDICLTLSPPRFQCPRQRALSFSERSKPIVRLARGIRRDSLASESAACACVGESPSIRLSTFSGVLRFSGNLAQPYFSGVLLVLMFLPPLRGHCRDGSFRGLFVRGGVARHRRSEGLS